MSEVARELLDRLPGGRRLWMPLLWGGLSAWLVPHITSGTMAASPPVLSPHPERESP